MKITTLSFITVLGLSYALGSTPLWAQDASQPAEPTDEIRSESVWRSPEYVTRSRFPYRKDPKVEEARRKALAAQTQGKLLLKAGKPKEAITALQESLGYDRINGLAFQLLAEAYTATGQLDKAVDTYRTVMYNRIAPGVGNNQCNNINVVMDFALVLLRTNNIEEAITWHNHGADLMNPKGNNTQGNPYTKIRFPRFGKNADAGEIAYTPQRLQALAYVALAKAEWNMGQEPAALGHFREAMRLYPESPVPHFFLGEVLPWRDDSKAAYARAAQLGDDKVKAAAYKEIRIRR